MATDDWVIEEKRHLERQWEPARQNWIENASFYNQTKEIWSSQQAAEGRPKIRPGIWTAIPDHAVSYQVSDEPKIKRHPVGHGETHKERAERVENALQVIASRVLRDSIDPPIRAAYRNLFIYGYMAINGPRIKPLQKKRPEKRPDESLEEFDIREARYENDLKSQMPFAIDVPPPDEILLPPFSKYPTHGIRVAKMYGHEIEQLSMRKSLQGKGYEWRSTKDDRYTEKTIWEYVDAERHKLMLDGGEIFVNEPNVYDLVFFKHAFSGWGGRPAGEDGFNPKYLAKSLYDPVKDTLIAIAQHFAGKQANLIDTVFQHWRFSKSVEPQQAIDELNTPNAPVTADPGEISRLETPELNNWLFRQTEELYTDLELSTYAFTLMGLRQSGVNTATQQAILSNAAQRIFAAPRAQMEGIWSLIMGDILRLTDLLKIHYGIDALRLGGEVLRSEDIEGDYNVEVKFELLDPMLHLNEKQHAMAEHQTGLLSWEGYQRVAKRENIVQIQREIIEDGVRMALMNLSQQVAVEEASKLQLAEQIASKVGEMAQTQMGGNGKTPYQRQALNNAVAKPPLPMQ